MYYVRSDLSGRGQVIFPVQVFTPNKKMACMDMGMSYLIESGVVSPILYLSKMYLATSSSSILGMKLVGRVFT